MQPFLSLEIYNLGKYLGLFYVWKISICINLPKLHFHYIYINIYIFFFCKFVFFFQHCSYFLMSSVKAKLIFRLRSIYFLCTQRKMNYCKKSAIRYNIEMLPILPYHMEFSYKPYGRIFGKEINIFFT